MKTSMSVTPNQNAIEVGELDVVRIVRFKEASRQFSGTEGVMRAPEIGDKGTVVHMHERINSEPEFMVESVNGEGFTLWLADFALSEVALEWKFEPSA